MEKMRKASDKKREEREKREDMKFTSTDIRYRTEKKLGMKMNLENCDMKDETRNEDERSTTRERTNNKGEDENTGEKMKNERDRMDVRERMGNGGKPYL